MMKSEWTDDSSPGSGMEDTDFLFNPDPLWTVEDVALFLRLKPETVRAMARRGDLPVMKVGRRWRFSGEEIRSWLSLSKQQIPG